MRPLVEEATATSSEEERTRWIKDVEFGLPSARLALLIPRLRGLREICLVPFGRPYIQDMLTRAAAATGPAFPYLTTGVSSFPTTGQSTDSSSLLPLFEFPTICKIHEFQIRDTGGEPKKARASGLIEIDLQNSNIAHGMPALIGSCEGLKRFRVEHGGLVARGRSFQPYLVYQALLAYRTTLE